ncbi:unnamed protein product [Hydatigera taeniaeformis]|uniref:Secreted protein n=1 Tax=Hydatigena taeniaeformis TaxID=6205 RepID=A0A0R3X2U7_HYDTA|nr:unnamed protein product [Hydatigera taeniaeformis]
MRTWILYALVIVALVACFQLAEAKPAVTIDRAPHDLDVSGGGSKEIEGRPKRMRPKKGGKHGRGRGKLNQRTHFYDRPRSVEDDRKRGRTFA